MSKGKVLTKRKWRDFRKSNPKPKWINRMKFSRKWKLLDEFIHLGMGIPKKRKVLDWYN